LLPAKWKPVGAKTRVKVNGLSVSEPYEVDVRVELETTARGFLQARRTSRFIWIECKSGASRTIKRVEIAKLDHAANDVLKAQIRRREPNAFVGRVLASNGRFDQDALNLARQESIGCVYDDGKVFHALTPIPIRERWK
jgi:hypothetical protein